MEFHVLELSKLPTELKENASDMLLWAKFISAEREEEFSMLATKNPYIKSAYEQLQVISQDKTKRLEYEAREKAIRDHNQLLYEAEQRGIKEGIKQGVEQGIKQGVEQGMTQGKIQGQKETVLNLHNMGMKEDFIAKAVNVSIELVRQWIGLTKA